MIFSLPKECPSDVKLTCLSDIEEDNTDEAKIEGLETVSKTDVKDVS